MRHTLLKIASIAALAMTSMHVVAYDWTITAAHVTLIEPSNMGQAAGNAAIFFQVDQSAGGCTAGTGYMYYVPVAFTDAAPVGNDKQMVNSKAILSTLQLALALGYNVKIQGYTGTGGFCQVSNVMSLSY